MGKKITHEEFKIAFETKYDGILELRNSVYKSSKEVITVYCIKHGSFDRTPSALLNDTRSRHPCPTCVKEIQAQEVIGAWKDYLEKIKKVVDCTNLDFSKVDYKGSQKEVTIICSIHGPFPARPAHMLNKKSGCPSCGRSKRKNLGAEEILRRLKKVHKDKYKFNIPHDAITTTKITFYCPEHGEKTAIISNLLSGKGCSECGKEAAAKKRTLSTSAWIIKAQKVHGDKYDYSKTKYINSRTKVTVTCPEHGDFKINPSNHIQKDLKRGCTECSGGKLINFDNKQKRLSQNEFLKRVSEVAPDNLDFSKSLYKGNKKTLTVTCKIHGDFDAWPSNLFNGQNCGKCAVKLVGENKRIGKNVILARLREKFKNTYEIDENSVKMVTHPIRLKCQKHGWFEGLLGNLMNSAGCSKCTSEKTAKIRAKKQRLTRGEIISRFKAIHKDRYNYSISEPDGILSEIEIECPKHGIFKQKVHSHLEGKGCTKCGREQKQRAALLSEGELYSRLNELNKNIFIYPPNLGIGLRDEIPIICREHGLFFQELRTHLKGNGCSQCSQSLGAKRVAQWLSEHQIIFQVEFRIPAGTKGLPLRADFYLPEHDLFIEYDGEQHFRPITFFGMDEKDAYDVFKAQQERDAEKELWIKNNGFKLLRIRFDQNVFDELNKYFH